MKSRPDLDQIVSEAKRKGYFATDDFPSLRFTPQEFGELVRLLDKRHIPFGRPEVEGVRIGDLTQADAQKIIDALRRGIPASAGIAYYSAGREDLLESVRRDLVAVSEGMSRVRFLNADIGHGKTHALYLLREFAYLSDFVVSIVPLSQDSCPLHDFMAVYTATLWGLRTADQRRKPALSNIFDRWIDNIRRLDATQISRIVRSELSPNLREIMAAYADASNLFRPDEKKRLQVLKYLGGESVDVRDLRQLGIKFRLNSENALQVLSEMAMAIRHIGFKGICILFDEAEAIHSFAYSSQRDAAYANLRQIIDQSRQFPRCYFIYATTPSFFDSYGGEWLRDLAGSDSTLELARLSIEERQTVGEKIAKIYAAATDTEVPPSTVAAIRGVGNRMAEGRMGDYVRTLIGILDECRASA